MCKHCIARQDHHCIWINNCVGDGNHHYFLYFIIATSVLLTYGSSIGYSLMSDILQRSTYPPHMHPPGTWNPQVEHWSKGLSWYHWIDCWSWVLSVDVRVGAVTLLAALTAPMGWGFLAYHLYLLWAGTTTNETIKWSDVRADIRDGWVFIAPKPTSIVPQLQGTDIEPDVQWPKPSTQIFWRDEDGKIPFSDGADYSDHLGNKNPLSELAWRRATGLKEVENIYDIGFVKNLKDILRLKIS
jgi:hypothetical protein